VRKAERTDQPAPGRLRAVWLTPTAAGCDHQILLGICRAAPERLAQLPRWSGGSIPRWDVGPRLGSTPSRRTQPNRRTWRTLPGDLVNVDVVCLQPLPRFREREAVDFVEQAPNIITESAGVAAEPLVGHIDRPGRIDVVVPGTANRLLAVMLGVQPCGIAAFSVENRDD